MKLGFSTLGCPQWSYKTILDNGTRYGFDGFQIRGIMGELDLLKIPELQPKRRAETLRMAKEADLEIMMLMTSCKFSSESTTERKENIEAAKANIDLANNMGIDKIRVFGGLIDSKVDSARAYSWLVECLYSVAEYGTKAGVYVALETHDDCTDTYVVKDILELVNHPFLKVLWDTHHPWRIHNQTPKQCWENIGRYVIDTHFKDSFSTKVDPSGYRYCLLGEGEFPVKDALRQLWDAGYEGYLTLEWEKRWKSYLPDPSVGFPQYMDKIREYISELD